MFRVSCLQLRSSNNIRKNIIITRRLIMKAVKQKSDFILTPEMSSIFSLNKIFFLSTLWKFLLMRFIQKPNTFGNVK